jgi:hypothetical protein
VTTRDALNEAMHSDSVDDALKVLIEREVWLADADTMTQAIHSVYCGVMADHDQPNEKDRDQARRLISAIGESIGLELQRTRDQVPIRSGRAGPGMHRRARAPA